MQIELLVTIFVGVFSGLGILIRLSYQVGKFTQRVDFIETRLEAVEKKVPLTIVRGSKK